MVDAHVPSTQRENPFGGKAKRVFSLAGEKVLP